MGKWKRNWFWIVIGLIVISWIANITYFESKKLKEPIVLHSYIDQMTDDYTEISILYLTNKDEVVKAEALSFDGIELYTDSDFLIGEEHVSEQQYEREFTHQYLKRARFILHQVHLNSLRKKQLDLDDAYISFSNHQRVPANLDYLKFREYKKEDTVFDSHSSFGNTDGLSGEFSNVLQLVSMDAIQLPEEIRNDIDMKIIVLSEKESVENAVNLMNGMNWDEIEAPLYTEVKWPLQLKGGEKIGVIVNTTKAQALMKTINLELDWSGALLDGSKIKHTIWINSDPELTQQQVNELVKKARSEER